MKKLVFVLLSVLVSFGVFSQNTFEIYNNDGIIGVSTIDEKGYTIIDSIDGTSMELYEKVKMYVGEVMVNPDCSIVADQRGKFLKWETYTLLTDFDYVNLNYLVYCNYLTSVSFKDNKIKVDYYVMRFETSVKSNIVHSFAYNQSISMMGIYKKNGKMTKHGFKIKNDIETFFTNGIDEIKNSLVYQDEDW